MKKTLLGLLACAGVFSATAAVDSPTYFESDFVDQMNHGYGTPQGYITYGVDGNIDSNWSRYFVGYKPNNAYVFISWGEGTCAATTPCCFTNDDGDTISPDQWLITPEIEIADKEAMFCFNVMQSGATGLQKFSVYVSETGTAKEDFKLVADGSLSGQAQSIFLGARRFVLSGYQGKKVHLAIVSHSGKAGLMGFYDLVASQYYLNVKNADDLETIVLNKNYNNSSIGVQYSISTPIEVKGFTATLRTEKGFETKFTTTTTLNKSKFVTSQFVFPEKVDMQGETQQKYTITIQPNDESLTPTVISGTLIMVEEKYQASALVEEITGSWCGWCPRGIAFMEYYKDKYNSLGKGKVIPIMLHDGDMMQCNAGYLSPVMTRMSKYQSQVGYPMALLNRSAADDPAEIKVEAELNSLSYGQLNILEAGFDGGDTSALRVRVGNKVNITTDSEFMRMALVLVENDVHGTTDDWNQTDYFGNYGESSISQAYGMELVPYFKLFLNVNTKYADGTPYIPGRNIYYPDVARAITPSYDGALIPGGWTADEVRVSDMVINIPMPGATFNPSAIQNIENCVVVAMLIGPDGSVVGSDMLPYSEWLERLDGSGVTSAVSESLSLTAIPVADGLGIKLNENAKVYVWGVDGTQLYAGNMQPGEHILSIAKGQTVIVKAEGAGKTATAKVVL